MLSFIVLAFGGGWYLCSMSPPTIVSFRASFRAVFLLWKLQTPRGLKWRRDSISMPEGQRGLVQSALGRQTRRRQVEIKSFPLGVTRCALFEVTDLSCATGLGVRLI